LKRFTKSKLDFYFDEITLQWLNDYEKWLRANQCKETSMSAFFRTLRSSFNKAIADNHVKADAYPFKTFKISKFDTTTEKRAITKESNKQIMNVNLDTERKYIQLSKDLYVFSYLCGGINFADMANLQYSNINGEKLSYIRQKTGKKIAIPVSVEAMQIVNKYMKESICTNDYVFPILDKNNVSNSLFHAKERVFCYSR